VVENVRSSCGPAKITGINQTAAFRILEQSVILSAWQYSLAKHVRSAAVNKLTFSDSDKGKGKGKRGFVVNTPLRRSDMARVLEGSSSGAVCDYGTVMLVNETRT